MPTVGLFDWRDREWVIRFSNLPIVQVVCKLKPVSGTVFSFGDPDSGVRFLRVEPQRNRFELQAGWERKGVRTYKKWVGHSNQWVKVSTLWDSTGLVGATIGSHIFRGRTINTSLMSASGVMHIGRDAGLSLPQAYNGEIEYIAATGKSPNSDPLPQWAIYVGPENWKTTEGRNVDKFRTREEPRSPLLNRRFDSKKGEKVVVLEGRRGRR